MEALSYWRKMLKKLTLTLILLASGALAQTSVTPLPNPKMQFLSAAGVPLAGGKICSFAAGTTTPITTYSESTGSSANTNPITLDSGGFATIFVTSSAIKFIVYSSVGADSNCPNAGVSQYTVDGIAPWVFGNTVISGTLSVSGAVSMSSTLGVTGKLTPTGGIVGKTDASDATAGNVGEFVRTKQAAPQSLTTGTILSLGSISLTAGDWDIQANAVFSGTSTTITFAAVAISTSAVAIAPADNSFENETATALITGTAISTGHALVTPTFRVSISSTTSYFLLTQATFGSNAVNVAGTIRARRVR